MAWRIVKQPDGKFARFSDVVDNFTDANLSADQAVELCIDEYGMTPEQAKEKVRAGEEDWPSMRVGIPGSGSDRWNDALETIVMIHGREALHQVLESMGLADPGQCD